MCTMLKAYLKQGALMMQGMSINNYKSVVLPATGAVSPRRNSIPTPEFVNSNQLAYVFDASN
jgi:hypothetical protein